MVFRLSAVPESLVGEGRDPVFQMNGDATPETLSVRPDRYPHAFVEPRALCLLSAYESALAGTRGDWSKVGD